MKVAELKEELEKRGLDTSGLKADLQARYDEAIAAENADTTEEAKETEEAQESAEPAESEQPTNDEAPAENPTEDEAIMEVSVAEESKKKESVTEETSEQKGEAKTEEVNDNGGERSRSRSRSKSRSRSREKKRSRSRSRSKSGDKRARTEDTKLYIGNLAYKTDERELEYHFQTYGKITDIFIPKDRNTRRSRGYAFVTFQEEKDADNAVKGMDNVDVDGRRIRVEKANAKRSGGPPPPRRSFDHRRDERRRSRSPRRSYGSGRRY